jgi:hypothetical protein
MWYSAEHSIVMARIKNPRLTKPLRVLLDAPNSYQYDRYSLLKRETPLGILARRRNGLAAPHVPSRGENALTALADRFTGGATTNSLMGHADRTTGSKLEHLN